MLTKSASNLSVALGKLFDTLMKFEQQNICPNLRFASAEHGPFGITCFIDNVHITLMFSNQESDQDLGYVVLDKNTLQLVDQQTYKTVLQEIDQSVKSLRVLQHIGRLDPKYF